MQPAYHRSVLHIDTDSDVECVEDALPPPRPAAGAAEPAPVPAAPAAELAPHAPAAAPLSATLTQAMAGRTLPPRASRSGDRLRRFLRGEFGFSAATVSHANVLPPSPASTHALFGTDSETERSPTVAAAPGPVLPVQAMRRAGCCPAGHPLVARRITRQTLQRWGPEWENATTCDACSAEIGVHSTSRRCEACDFDLCHQCAGPPPKRRWVQ